MTDALKNELESSSGRKIFTDFLKSIGKQDKIEKFDFLTDLYYQVNNVVNISAIKTVDDIYVKHYLDSSYPVKRFSGTVCDVGCGGGFPTIPLAILTDLHVTGLDSVGKKLLLIHKCVTELHLKNLKADYARSEDLAKLGRSYDTVCARALADVDKSISFCAPLVKAGGRLILYRTQNDNPAKKEILTKHFLTLEETEDYVLPGTDVKRRLFIYKK